MCKYVIRPTGIEKEWLDKVNSRRDPAAITEPRGVFVWGYRSIPVIGNATVSLLALFSI